MSRSARSWWLAVGGVIAVLIAGDAASQSAPSVETALQALRAAAPSTTWDAASAKAADVTCDGRADRIVVGYERATVWLGVVPGGETAPSRKPFTQRFAVARDSQDAFCKVPVRIELQALACETEDGPLAGCKPVAGCAAFSLVDEDCDAFHFYWNSEQQSLTGWRR